MGMHRPLLALPRTRARREFVQSVLPRFQAENPQLAVEAAVRRGQHPFLDAQYREWQAQHHTAAAALLHPPAAHPAPLPLQP